MSIKLDKLSGEVEYNILLIGESGVGKPTFVNAFANYIKFNSLDDALGSRFEEVIPTIFEIRNAKTGRRLFEIECGNDENELDTGQGYTRTQRPRIYEFASNGKLIRLIDTPAMEWNVLKTKIRNDYLNILSQCLGQFKVLHRIVLVTCGKSFTFTDIALLQMIHKSACNSFMICYTKEQYYYKSKDKQAFGDLKSNIEKLTRLTAKYRQNVFILDNCAYQCLAAHRRGHSFSVEVTNECRSNWIYASEQIQTLINCAASGVACEVTALVELIQSFQIMNLCMQLVKNHNYGSKTAETREILKFLKQNPTELKRIEDIWEKLLEMMLYSSMVSGDDLWLID